MNPVIYIGHKEYRVKGALKRTKSYYAEWSLHNKQQRKSLRVSNKVAAINCAHALHDKICLGERLDAPKEITIDDLIEQYLGNCTARLLAPKTIEKYTLTLNNFRVFCKEQGVVYAGRVGEVVFWKFVQTMDSLSLITRYDRIVIVQMLFKWGCEHAELIQRNPLRKLKLKKPQPTQQPCFTPEQARCLIDTAQGDLKPRIAFLVYTGCRFGEMRDLTWGDVDFSVGQFGVLHIRHGGSTGETKNRKSRRIHIHEDLLPLLQGVRRSGNRVFPASASKKHPKGDGPLNDRRFLMSVKRLCKRCSFEDPTQYKTHTFRHAFASLLARESVSYRYALSLMGHGSSKILDLYYTMYDKDAERAIAAIQLPPANDSAT